MNTTSEVSMSITHPELVKALAKPGEQIAKHLNDNPNEKHLLYTTLFDFAVSGERLDAVKKRVIYNKPNACVGTDTSGSYSDITGSQAHLVHMAVGIAGEAAELLQPFLNHILNGGELDINNVIEELGDLEFYIQGLRQELALSREHILQENINKLSVRYASLSYSDAAAQQRADKTETTNS